MNDCGGQKHKDNLTNFYSRCHNLQKTEVDESSGQILHLDPLMLQLNYFQLENNLVIKFTIDHYTIKVRSTDHNFFPIFLILTAVMQISCDFGPGFCCSPIDQPRAIPLVRFNFQ